jgi:hypothetical protein
MIAPLAASAAESLVKFEGGIGVIPVSSAAGTQNANSTFPDVNRNDVFGTPPGGQPWVIRSLSADVKLDDRGTAARISVNGRGLLLAGGNNIGYISGPNAAGERALSVRAKLFCNGIAHDSGLVAVDADGDFRINDVLTPVPPSPCTNAVLLIVNAAGRWFAAGIPKH